MTCKWPIGKPGEICPVCGQRNGPPLPEPKSKPKPKRRDQRTYAQETHPPRNLHPGELDEFVRELETIMAAMLHHEDPAPPPGPS